VHHVVNENRKNNKRRVKVAILDTGIDCTHDEIQTLEAMKSIKAWKGFPASLDPRRDRLGHGTHGASVFLRTAPQAELFIARVADDQGRIAPDKGYEAVINVAYPRVMC